MSVNVCSTPIPALSALLLPLKATDADIFTFLPGNKGGLTAPCVDDGTNTRQTRTRRGTAGVQAKALLMLP